MLLLQRDYITLDLEKTGERNSWTEKWDIYWLLITIQCNGKLKRHTTSFQVHREVFCEPSWNTGTSHWTVSNFWGIYATIELLDSLWYSLDAVEVWWLIEQKLRELD